TLFLSLDHAGQYEPLPHVEIGRAPPGGQIATVLRRVVVAVGRQKRRRIVHRGREGISRTKRDAARRTTDGDELQGVIRRRCLGLDEKDIAQRREWTPWVERARPGRGVGDIPLSYNMR